MRYRLRTLLILLALGPPLLAGGWCGWQEWNRYRLTQNLRKELGRLHREVSIPSGARARLPISR